MNGRTSPGGIEPPVRVRITPEESRLLTELILDHCGVLLGGDAGFLLERRLASRLDHLSLGSYLEYYHYLSYDLGGAAELLECIERVTTHETYLFREQFQLDAFQREILPVLLGRRGAGAPVVWSAGCSTGEEAYTIAALLAENARPGSRVIGSDISLRGVRTAEAGIYGRAVFARPRRSGGSAGSSRSRAGSGGPSSLCGGCAPSSTSTSSILPVTASSAPSTRFSVATS